MCSNSLGQDHWDHSWWTLVLLVCRKKVIHEERGIFACNYHWRGPWGPSFLVRQR